MGPSPTGLVAICLVLATGCQPVPKPDRAPVSPTPVGNAAPGAPEPAGAPGRAVELTADGPVAVNPSERAPTAGGGVLVGAWPRSAARIDLDEHAAPVRDILQRFARVSRLNFVVQDEVRGEVTVALTGVPWTQALEAVLRAKDLVAVLEGNVARVLPRTMWERERGVGRL